MSDVSNSFSAWETLPEDEPPLCIAVRRPVSPPRHYEAVASEPLAAPSAFRCSLPKILRLHFAVLFQKFYSSKLMKFLLSLIIIFSTFCHSLPPYKVSHSESVQPWIRRTRSNRPQEALHNKHVINVFGYNVNVPTVKVPKFIHSMNNSMNEFFVGPSGVVTKIKEFLKGNSKVSTQFFGRKVDFQANVPLSKEDVRKSFRSFLRKFRTDPMTRVLFVMYLNVVVVIVVYMVLLAKHVQISLQTKRDSLRKKNYPSPSAGSHVQMISPDISMPVQQPNRRQSPVSEDENKSVDWSAIANPSLLNAVNQETIMIANKPPRLLNDLESFLSPSKADDEPPSPSHRSNTSISSGEGPSTISPKQSNNSQICPIRTPSSNYFTALESTRSSFDASQPQYLPTIDKEQP
ncbi:hypothetical protein RB195_025502 [Necator americanus]|uniref:Uncharacterized protein n=1 Tax=Necator americanus TaxID=51031 RepID=A0ABR1ESK3_NECAM